MPETASGGAVSPVLRSMTSTLIAAPHFALIESPERYFCAKLLVQRRCGVLVHMKHSESRHPKLLHHIVNIEINWSMSLNTDKHAHTGEKLLIS